MSFSATYSPHTLRFRMPAGTSRGVLREKTVYFLHLHADGRTGTGECAPWRGLSIDATPDFETQLDAVCRRISAGEYPAAICVPHLPALQFGLEMAWLDWTGGGTGKLFDTPFTRGEINLPTHGLIWMDSPDGLRRQIEAKIAAGFTVIKMKIGAIDFADELAVLADIRRKHPAERIALRLDANGAFSAADAPEKLATLAQFDIEFIEQPIKPGHGAAMAQLCATSPIPIALDEELIGHHTPADRRRLLDAIRPQGIVLKPALVGGFGASDDWIAAATERGIQWWANSALESNIGLSAICQWVSARAPNRVHGLGTGKLYENNVAGRVKVVDPKLAFSPPPAASGDSLPLTGGGVGRGSSKPETFLQRWNAGQQTFTIHTSGSTGTPKPITLTRAQMTASARMTGAALGLSAGDHALVCLSTEYIAGVMMLVRGAVLGLELTIVPPSNNPLAAFPPATHFDFTALVPLQLQKILTETPNKIGILNGMKAILVGGAPVSATLERQLQAVTAPIYHTYGMTETVSHIALRRLNGDAPSNAFTPLPGVSLGVDARGCLTISAPVTGGKTLITNDRVELRADGSFVWLGRWDNVVNSGGVKIQVEQVEAVLAQALLSVAEGAFAARRFVVGGVSDERLGQKLVAVIEGEALSTRALSALENALRAALPQYHRPREIYFLPHFAETPTGKIDRRHTLAQISHQ